MWWLPGRQNEPHGEIYSINIYSIIIYSINAGATITKACLEENLSDAVVQCITPGITGNRKNDVFTSCLTTCRVHAMSSRRHVDKFSLLTPQKATPTSRRRRKQKLYSSFSARALNFHTFQLWKLFQRRNQLTSVPATRDT